MGYTLFQFPGGLMSEKIGPKSTLMVCTVGCTLITIISGLIVLGGFSIALMIPLFVHLSFSFRRISLSLVSCHCRRRYSKMVSVWFLGITQWNDFNGFGTWLCLNAPIIVYLAEYFGWQSTFFLISILGVIGTIIWWKYSKNWPNEHPDINQAELAAIGEPDFNNNQMTWPMVKEVLKNKNILFTALKVICP